MESCHLSQEADQANPTRADFDTHHMGTHIEPLLPRAPHLQRGSGNVQRLGGLTLGEPVGLQVAIVVKECSASEAFPALPPPQAIAMFAIDGEGGRGSSLVATHSGTESLILWGAI
jgi:hypothetical protein